MHTFVGPLLRVPFQSLLDRRDGHKYSLFLDMGSHHIYHARYLQVHHPRQASTVQRDAPLLMPGAEQRGEAQTLSCLPLQ